MEPNAEDGAKGRRMSERIRYMVTQHLLKEGYTAPFTEEQMEQGRKSYLAKARALKGSTDATQQELARVLEQWRTRHTIDEESKRSRHTLQILAFLSPLLDRKFQDLERVETHDLMAGLYGREDEREIHGLRFGPGVSRLVSRAVRQLLLTVLISLKRTAGRRLDDGEHWLPTSTLPNHDPKFKLHHLTMQDSDLSKKRENQLRALLQAPATEKEKSRKSEKDDQMKQHDADVQRVEEANRQRANQMFPSVEPSAQADADDDDYDKAAKQMKLMMMNKAAKDTGYAPSKDTRYVDRKLCTEDLVCWLENDSHFRATKVLLQTYLRLGGQKAATPSAPTAKEILSPSKKRGPPT